MRQRSTLQSGTGYNSRPFVEEIILTSEIQAIITSLGAVNAALYDFTDSSTLYQNELTTIPVTTYGDLIGRVTDLSGFNNHQLQTTPTARPLWDANGGKFDGVDDAMGCTLASPVATNQFQYLARGFVLDAWTGNSTAHNPFTISFHPGSNIYFRQRIRPDSPISGNRSLYSEAQNSSAPYTPTTPLVSLNAAGGAAWVLGKAFSGESFFYPNNSVRVAVNGGSLTQTAFTGSSANTYNRLALGNFAALPGLFQRTERRAIWMAGPNLPSEYQRSRINLWLKQRKI